MSRNAELQTRRVNAVPRGVGTSLPIFAARAVNAELWDEDGNRLIDFAGGIAVLNTGHLHPKVIDAVKGQLDRFTHTCFQVTGYDSYVELAERLNDLAPIPGPNKTIFLTTGAEAVENAVKIARYATGRSAVIAFGGAFHGRTAMGMALTGKVQPYKAGFGPMPADVYHAPFPNAFRGVSVEAALDGVESLFKTDVDPARVAAIIVEPVQGEGGFNVAPPAFLKGLRAICDRHGILLIADEIQTGFGRTAKMFAMEHSGVAPDLITMAKSLAGGFPLSAVTGRAEVMESVPPGGLGGTYGGNPLACVAALAVLDVFKSENLLARASHIGDRTRARLEALGRRNDFACIGEVRGLGAMIAVELVKDRLSKEPAADLTRALIQEAGAQGLIILSCGTHGNVVRFLMPLTADDALIDEGFDRFERSLETVLRRVA